MTTATFQRGPVTVYFGEKSGKYPDGNQVIVRGADTCVAFDTPLVANRLGAELDGVDCVILGHMHEDHAAGLHRLPRARVYAHDADLEAVRSWDGLARHYGYTPAALADMRRKVERDFHWVARPDALGYGDGARWELGGGVRVVARHLPGHTAGHCALIVEPEGIAFIGDIDLSSFGPYYGDATSSLADFRASLRRVAGLPASVWITSHHKGVVTARDTFLALLEAYARRLDARDEAIVSHLAAQGPCTLDALVEHRFLYPHGYHDVYIDDAERRTTLQHLAALAAAGRAAEEDGLWRALG